ncbi:EF-P 5-aminopentanol modification-associated protein YfmH [Acidilutibacter cellobiosedens]|uniref:EF-P 5-aminopentanol modification-associated protein YfmH n=1 Tax=Acidilutibacter cellobiosedens TaxID=2507161 RepID=UPI00197D6DB3|nr:pitrilysin family protein [Acidilutibacter cellobiosedens]
MSIKTYENIHIKEKVLYDKSNNGLKVYYIPKEGYSKKFAIFATDYGSNDKIGESPEGVAHFLEHKMFEEPDENIFDKFSYLGANVNAYTNFNQTAYLFSCTDNFYENLKLLIHFVQDPYFTDENVEKEKGIIEQEIKMYEDSPNWKVYFNCLKGMYINHPVKNDIAGTVESIKKINKEILYKCYNTFYHPQNMVLVIAGDLSFEKIMETVNKREAQKGSIEGKIERVQANEPENIQKSYMEEYLPISIPLFSIGFKDNFESVNESGEELILRDISTNIMLNMIFGESSLLFQSLYNEGLIDNSFGSYYTGYKDYGHSIIVGQTLKPKLVFERIESHIEDLKRKGLSREDFERIKRKYIGNFLTGLNSIEYIGSNFVNYYFIDFIFLDYLNAMNKINFKDIEDRFISHLRKDNFTFSVIKPVK